MIYGVKCRKQTTAPLSTILRSIDRDKISGEAAKKRANEFSYNKIGPIAKELL